MIKTICKCDRCENEIKPNTGFRFLGNVLVVKEDFTEGAGVIGDCFSYEFLPPAGKSKLQNLSTKLSTKTVEERIQAILDFASNSSREFHYCKNCVVDLLELRHQTTPIPR